jgi:hypothetical protein
MRQTTRYGLSPVWNGGKDNFRSMLPYAKRGLRLARLRPSAKKEKLSHCLKRSADLVMLNAFASFVLVLWFFARMENSREAARGKAGSSILYRVPWR